MAFSDFFKGRRGPSDRDDNRWHSQDHNRNEGRPNYLRDEQGFERRGWRQGSDYYGNDPERYSERGYGSERSQSDDFNARPEYRGSENEWQGGSSFNDRWKNAYDPSFGRSSQGGRYGSQDQVQDRDDARWWNEMAGRPGAESYGGQTGQHRGRGPRGYRRSDDRIHEDVCECLTDDDRIDASNVQVTVKECEVTLSGTVNSREEKRRAEDLIERLSGVRDVHNMLRVVNEGGRIEGSGTHTDPTGVSQATQSDQATRSDQSQSARH
jgi:osmotically-inducible protein OsmY